MAERGDGEKFSDGARQVGLATWNGLAAADEWVADAFRPDDVAAG